ncbi:MAG: HlyU family transcriptional regulator [Candidatus Competibacterales bacterium]|nr:HlyU family transcriptional regulator [Candidatus Competibacterales bacterium]
MSLWRRLFGGGAKPGGPVAETVEYKGYAIRPAPRARQGQYLIAGVISKAFPGGEREQWFIRADTHPGHEEACQHAIQKARQLIDERGDELFRDDDRPI